MCSSSSRWPHKLSCSFWRVVPSLKTESGFKLSSKLLAPPSIKAWVSSEKRALFSSLKEKVSLSAPSSLEKRAEATQLASKVAWRASALLGCFSSASVKAEDSSRTSFKSSLECKNCPCQREKSLSLHSPWTFDSAKDASNFFAEWRRVSSKSEPKVFRIETSSQTFFSM